MAIKATENHIKRKSQGIDSFEELGTFLMEKGWYPERLENNNTYKVIHNVGNYSFICLAQLREDLGQFIFYVVAPLVVPLEKRNEVAEYITRANYGLRIGNLEMDFSDGEIRYKSSVDFECEHLSHNLINNAIHPALCSMERYLYGLFSIINEDVIPLDAIASVEYEGFFSLPIGHA
ncbi:MAG: YbjN domain-containing protein [Alphaproteobacteria bacterium]|nr:YbjN domain-containing protein [Alphaproteobacteria bacterium]